MRFALAQFRSTIDPRKNLALVTDVASRAVRDGVDVVVFPEVTMHSFPRASTQAVEAFDGPWALAVQHLAGDPGIIIIAGTFTKAPGVRVHNTLLATDKSEGRYDKIHLFDALGQHKLETVVPGLRSTSVEVIGHGLGLAICHDARFLTRLIDLALGGAMVMMVCASWASGLGELYRWRIPTTARATDSAPFVVAVDQTLQDDAEAPGGPMRIGHSMAVDPTGRVLLELGVELDLAFVDVDSERVAVTCETLPVLDGNRLRSL